MAEFWNLAIALHSASIIGNTHSKENLEKSCQTLSVSTSNRIPPWMPKLKLHRHQVVSINWMADQEGSLAGGELLALPGKRKLPPRSILMVVNGILAQI